MIKSIKNLSVFEKLLWLISVIVVSMSFFVSKDIEWITLIASLIGVTALIFIAKGDVLGQILTVVFSILYAVVSYKQKYYGEMITYLGMTAPIAVLSIITWLKNPYSENQVKVNHIKKKTFLILSLITVIVTALFYFILKAFGTASLLISTVSITTSFLAASLTMLRSPYYAAAYALNDIVLIIMWIIVSVNDMSYFPMILCFVMFLVNDIYGFINWNRMKKEQNGNF